MVAFNRIPFKEYETLDYSGDPWNVEDEQWSDEFDSCQHMRDLIFWSGLSLAIGIFIGMGVMCL